MGELGRDPLQGLSGKKPRLQCDKLPDSTHGSNLRSIFKRSVWDRLRYASYAAADHRCEICGWQRPTERVEDYQVIDVDENGVETVSGLRWSTPKGRLECHEAWAFEIIDDQPVQRLVRLVTLCAACHLTQHIGRAAGIGLLGDVRDTLARVNGWTDEEIRRDFTATQVRYMELKRFEWDLDLSALAGEIELPGYPDLYVPAAERAALGVDRR